MRKPVKPSSLKFLIRTAGTILSASLFIWLLVQQDWSRTWQILSEMPMWLLPVAFSLYFGSVLVNALRWFFLIRAQDVKINFIETLKMVLAGNFASNFLPSTVGGDAARIAGLARFTNLTISVASTFVDRILNVLAMFSALPFSIAVFGPFWLGDWQSRGEGAILAGVLPQAWRAKLSEWVKRAKDAINVWRNRPGVLFLGFALSWGGKLMIFSALWLLARGLGMEIAFYQIIGVGAITYALSILPISLNGFGLREVSMTTLYIQLGATLEQASTLVVATRFILMLETLPGAIWLSDTIAGNSLFNDTERRGC